MDHWVIDLTGDKCLPVFTGEHLNSAYCGKPIPRRVGSQLIDIREYGVCHPCLRMYMKIVVRRGDEGSRNAVRFIRGELDGTDWEFRDQMRKLGSI